MKLPVSSILLIFSILLLSCNDGTISLPKKIDYNFHVRPVLSDKCFACHGPDESKRESGLRLDVPDGAYAAFKDQPGKFAIIPGDPEGSELLARIHSSDSSLLMPPPSSRLFLTDREKAILHKWILQGAEYSPHWAFVAPKDQPAENAEDSDWIKNEIDTYILASLEENGLKPGEEAKKEVLLRRVAFDITGLPPTLEMQEQFLSDDSPNAYEKLVDRLLAMPEYGEKMAVHWMDVARYADSHGYQDDGLRTMWPWRDWVIHAFNANYPYDKFARMQLAGDLIKPNDPEYLLATGFNRNHKITQEGGVIDEEYRIEYVTDRTNTFGKAFLGLTFECAKCHDHKYDPISQKDYFSTFAFFNKVPEKGLFGTIDASFADPPNMRITPELAQRYLPFLQIDSMDVEVMIMKDSLGLRTTHVLERGAYDRPTEPVKPSLPESIFPFDSVKWKMDRTGLADWLLDPQNPLAARVFANRIWQEIFGRGLVPTSGDFGMQGDFPTHPQLLDHLAVSFRESGWDIKKLVKYIVTSATYRLSGEVTPEMLKNDPDNTYYSRYSRTRLKAEEVRDHVLASSGLLVRQIGGPSVKPYQPAGLWEAATSGRGLLQTYVQDHDANLYRRGLYTFIKRTVPPPVMLMFDASNRDQCEVRRLRTSTPLQSLVMLNDPTVLEASRVLADRLLASGKPLEKVLEEAFRRILCRVPSENEMQMLINYHTTVYKDFQAQPASAKAFVEAGEFTDPEVKLDDVERAALMQVVHTIYNMEEAIVKS